VVVSFLAILELVRERLIELGQAEAFGPIYLRPAA
jgi:chromatin segregation and condensation protein Rec8/ScpA/Scc1 (kleisin family)